MKVFLVFGLLCLLQLAQARYYDIETDFVLEALDAHISHIKVWSTVYWPSVYVSINDTNGKAFHFLMYHNRTLGLPLNDQKDVLQFPKHSTNPVQSHCPDFAVRDLTAWHWQIDANTTSFAEKGIDIFKPFHVTIGYINDTFSVPFVTKPLVFAKKVEFMDSLTIAPVLRQFRLEDYHPAFFACMLAFYIFSMILCLVFSGNQPLKSRGVVPVIGCILQFFVLLPDLMVFVPRPVKDLGISEVYFYDITYWIVHNYFRYAGILMCMLLTLQMAIRFVILLNVNARKQLFVADRSQEVGDVKLTWKIIKLLGSRWITPIFMVFWYIVFSAYLSLVWINYDTRSHYWFLACVPAILVLAVLTLIGDIITNYKRILKCQLKWLWSEDIFYFRMELYLLTLFIIMPYFIVCYLIISDDNFPEIYYVNDTHNGLLFAINSISMFLFYVLQVGFVLVVTILQFLRQKCSLISKKEDDKGFITKLLENKDSHDLFEAYCKNEFSLENISCYDEIQNYKQIKEGRGILVNRMLKLYLSGSSSELEVNVTGNLLNSLNAKIQELNQNEQGLWPDDLFSDLEKDVLANLKDTYFRFRATADWKQFLKAKNFMEEIYGKVTLTVEEQ